MIHVGIDVHQEYSELCEVGEDGSILDRCRLTSTEASFRRWFEGREGLRVVLECSGSSRWVSRLLRELGSEVVVVNPRRVRLIAESSLKSDEVDAEVLARLSCFGRRLLHPVYEGATRRVCAGPAWGRAELWCVRRWLCRTRCGERWDRWATGSRAKQ